MEIRSLEAKPEEAGADGEGNKLPRVALHREDKAVHLFGGRTGDDQERRDVVDEEAAERGAEGAGGGEDVREGEEALAGDLLLQAGLTLCKRLNTISIVWCVAYLGDDDDHHVSGRRKRNC